MKQIHEASKQRTSMNVTVPAQARPKRAGRLHWFADDLWMFCRAIMLLLLFALFLLWLVLEGVVFKIYLNMSYLRGRSERTDF